MNERISIRIPYGKDSQIVEIPKNRCAGIIHPNSVPMRHEETEILKALSLPTGGPSFDEFLKPAGKTLVIVNDGTRPTPTPRVLDLIAPRLLDQKAEFIVATGVHRPPTEEEYRLIFGGHLSDIRNRSVIHVHKAKETSEMVHLGTSKNGTEMWVNRKIIEADRLLVIGSVEPHYFAGYTGGRKAILPGLASYETITMNHKYALRREATAMVLDGNPVHDDMIDALSTLGSLPIFSIQIVLDRDRRIYAAFGGDIISSMQNAIGAANEVYAVTISGKEDIVVSVAPYPMDVDLYQSQKALDNGKLALNDQGILILVSKCRTGIGESTFYDLMASCRSSSEIIKSIDAGYKLGYHKAAKLAEIGLWSQIWAVTDLEASVLERIFIRPFTSIQSALDTAMEFKGPSSRVLFLIDGSITVPMIGHMI